MRTMLLTVVLAWPATVLAQKDFSRPPLQEGSAVPASQNTRFTLINDSTDTIDNLDISPVASGNWGHDVFGTVALPAHNRVIVGPVKPDGCMYDIRVRYHADMEETRRRIDLCRTDELTFTGKDARRINRD